MAMSNYVLRAKEVCKTFSGVYALNKVNIDIRQGEVHCLAGENGCGKSTLINIISGVYTLSLIHICIHDAGRLRREQGSGNRQPENIPI